MSTMKFCRECNNILYPREDRDKKVLLYACRNCDHQEVADNNCVYRNEVLHSDDERTQVLQDIANDPTLPRTKNVRCANCQHGEAVFFQATARGEEALHMGVNWDLFMKKRRKAFITSTVNTPGFD